MNKDIYIKGDAYRSKDVQTLLEYYGGENEHCYEFDNENVLYYIDRRNGIIEYAETDAEKAILKALAEEVKLSNDFGKGNPVLVRRSPKDRWQQGIFLEYDEKYPECPYQCVTRTAWKYCIPYDSKICPTDL